MATTHITIARTQEPFVLTATNTDGATAVFDSAPDAGGLNQGLRPMQMLVASLGACSSIDVLAILQKMQQPVREYRVELAADREENPEPPNLYTRYHLHYVLYGDLNPALVKRAIDLSMTKYCSVARTLEKTAPLTYDFEILP